MTTLTSCNLPYDASDAHAHLANEPRLTLALSFCGHDADNQWYAAFHDPDADEMTPERGWGYGATPDEAVSNAVASFRATEDENAG